MQLLNGRLSFGSRYRSKVDIAYVRSRRVIIKPTFLSICKVLAENFKYLLIDLSEHVVEILTKLISHCIKQVYLPIYDFYDLIS